MRSTKLVIVLGMLLLSCSIEPVPISYGMDACTFCSMTIVDRGHAAEYVTTKGKAFKFDSIECMVRELNRSDDGEPALLLVNDYSNPGTLLDAREALVVRCEDIPSPMGEFLSAFPNNDVMKKVLEGRHYEVFAWNEIQLK